MKTFPEVLASKRAFGINHKSFTWQDTITVNEALHGIDTSSVSKILESHNDLNRRDFDIDTVMGGRIDDINLSPVQMSALYILWYRQGCRPHGYRASPLGDARYVFYKTESDLMSNNYERDIRDLNDDEFRFTYRDEKPIRLRLTKGFSRDYHNILRSYVEDVSTHLLMCDPEIDNNQRLMIKHGRRDYPDWYHNLNLRVNSLDSVIDYLKSNEIDFMKDSPEYIEENMDEAINSIPDEPNYCLAYKISLRTRYQTRASIRVGYGGEVRKDVAGRLEDMGLIENIFSDHLTVTKPVDIYVLTNKGLRLVRSLFGMPNMAYKSRTEDIQSRYRSIDYKERYDQYQNEQDYLWEQAYKNGELQEFAARLGIQARTTFEKFFGDYRTFYNTREFYTMLSNMIPEKHQVPTIRFRIFNNSSTLEVWAPWQQAGYGFATEIKWNDDGHIDNHNQKIKVENFKIDAYLEHAYDFDEYINFIEVIRIVLDLFESYHHGLVNVEMMEGM